jgi:hypothetical protein
MGGSDDNKHDKHNKMLKLIKDHSITGKSVVDLREKSV